MGSGGSGVAEQTSEAEGRSTRGSPRVDGVTTLLLLFCCGSNQFDPVANSRCGSASQVGRPEPFAGLRNGRIGLLSAVRARVALGERPRWFILDWKKPTVVYISKKNERPR
jgi:hypothetical protein